MAALTWRHHTLIQALQSRGPLSQPEFHSIFTGITGKSPDAHKNMFNDYLLKINKELSYVQLELRAFRNQYDGKVHYGIVNTVSDEQSKLGTKYSVPQIAFFKAILEIIVQDDSAKGCISNFDALNIRLESQVPNATESQSHGGSQHVPAAFKNFSMSQKENTIAKLTLDKWLSSSPDNSIGLGVRAFLDLRSWLNSNGVPSCEVCNEPGVKADLCPNEGCGVRMHQYCVQRKFSQTQGEKACPGCHTQWHGIISKVEATDEDGHDEPTQAGAPPVSTRKRLRSRNR